MIEQWRLILTDTETLSGVAPVCPQQTAQPGPHDRVCLIPPLDVHGVYDCCPGPHLECWSEIRAKQVLHTLNYFEVEVCS